jgi:hypothetical protein
MLWTSLPALRARLAQEPKRCRSDQQDGDNAERSLSPVEFDNSGFSHQWRQQDCADNRVERLYGAK